MSKLTVAILDFKPLHKNTLVGFVSARVPEMCLTLHDIALHQKGDSRWAQLPAKPQVGRDGKAIVKDGKARGAFSHVVIAALLDRFPHAFNATEDSVA